VSLCSRTGAEIENVSEEIHKLYPGRVTGDVCDVSNPDDVRELFRSTYNAFDHQEVDILVNNAGIAESAPLTKTADELWRRHLAINLSGTFYCMREALPHMIEHGWGRVINIASIAGKIGAPYIAAYSASKHGVLGLTRSAALEVAAKGITVNAICPGYVDTDMTTRGIENITKKTGLAADQAMDSIRKMSPQNRLVEPEEVAALALLLASEEGRGINGQAINVDGGTVLY